MNTNQLSSEMKIKHLKWELVGAFPANSITYDLNEILAKHPGDEALVWNAAMLLVEEEALGLIQVTVGNQIRWLMMLNSECTPMPASNTFHCPLDVKKNKKGK